MLTVPPSEVAGAAANGGRAGSSGGGGGGSGGDAAAAAALLGCVLADGSWSADALAEALVRSPGAPGSMLSQLHYGLMQVGHAPYAAGW